MSSTKNNRIRRLIQRIVVKSTHPMHEMPNPFYRRVITLKKGDQQIEIFDNTHGRRERQKTEVKRLETCLGKRIIRPGQVPFYESPGKKERMGKFAHKKDSRAKKAEAKQNAKKSKGMKKGG